MDRDRLLNEVLGLPYAARIHRLRALGQNAISNPQVAALLDGWEQGDWQQRLCCLQSCTGTGDSERLHRLVDDSSRTIAGHALQLLAEHGSDEVVIKVLAKLPHSRRRQLLVRLGVRRRFDVVDAFLNKAFAESVPRIAELLPYGSAQAVNRHWGIADESGGVRFWERLARRHPRIAVKSVLDKVAATKQPDGLLLQYARRVVFYTGRTEPDLTVQLIKTLAEFTPLSSLQITPALYQRPNQFAKIVLEVEDAQPFSLVPVAHRIEKSLLRRILQERGAALPMQMNWFRKISPAGRSQIYQDVGRSWRDGEGVLPCAILALLPAEERIAEAKRMAVLPIMATRPVTQVAYAAYLPWQAMREIADRLLNHSEGESRAQGWAAILVSLRFHREEAGNVLTMIRKRKFEQDPVRQVILKGLAELPQGIWKSDHLEAIVGVVREALDATDLSHQSTVFLTEFVEKLIPAHPVWATQQLVIIYGERGNIGGYLLENRINDEYARTLESAFIDVGKHWGRSNRIGWLVWFASTLGKRLRVCQQLLQVLVELLGKESGKYDLHILQLLRKHLPFTEFEKLAQQLINSHESWVAMLPIFVFLHRHRQDWLEPFLSKRKFKMKGGQSVELVSLLQANGYHRYTASQQTVLASTLNGIITLPAGKRLPNDVWTMLRAMDILAVLPAVDPTRLIELTNDVRPVIADAAIRALGQLDGGQGVSTLITALGDARARLAIYALRQAMAEMPATRVLTELRGTPLDKVTVAKETIRLIGEYGGAAGGDWLFEMAKRELHRDVRIAVLRGLWNHLECPESWAILAEAAQSTDGQLLNGVVRIPADRLTNNSRRQLIDLLTGLASHPDAIIRLSVLRRFIEMPFPDKDGRLIQVTLKLLTAASPDERELATQTITANSTAVDAAQIADAIGKSRDQRRPLNDFVRIFTSEALVDAPRRRRLAPLARQVIAELRTDPITAGLRLTLAAAILGTDAFDQELQQLVVETFPIAAVIQDASAAIEQMGNTINRNDLRQLEDRLVSSADPHLRLLAFIALRVQAGDHQRWDDARRDRLIAFRNDSSAVVAIPAHYCFDAD